MDGATRDLVRRRAGKRCEYCRLPQKGHDERFSTDYIVPIKYQVTIGQRGQFEDGLTSREQFGVTLMAIEYSRRFRSRTRHLSDLSRGGLTNRQRYGNYVGAFR